MIRRVGVIELIASTASLHSNFSPAFWAELQIKRQFYSVMPQAVSVWSRQGGYETYYATYSGFGRPENLLPHDLDLVFIATPTQHVALASALAVIFRRFGSTVVLGGPHARAFPMSCTGFADIVVTDCDRRVIDAILSGEIGAGTVVRSIKRLVDLPLVEEREPEICSAAFSHGRQCQTSTIAVLSSLGCPYNGEFCSEWATPHKAFDASRMKRELSVIASRYPGALVGFHDPNFGVRFEEVIRCFEEHDEQCNPFVMESTLSLLSYDRLKRLRDAGCLMVAPGIESWGDYSRKSRTTNMSGEAKYAAISAKMREIEETIPTAQANIILGVDADAGDEPFALTKRFITEHPKIWTNVNIPIPFGSTPFAERTREEGRLIEALPFPFYTAPYLALHPSNYTPIDYLHRLARIYEVLVSPSLFLRRLAVLPSAFAKGVAFARTMALRTEFSELKKFLQALSQEADLQKFYAGHNEKLPAFFEIRLRARLGQYRELIAHEWLLPTAAPMGNRAQMVTV